MLDKGRTWPSFSASSIVPEGSTIIPETIVLDASQERVLSGAEGAVLEATGLPGLGSAAAERCACYVERAD